MDEKADATCSRTAGSAPARSGRTIAGGVAAGARIATGGKIPKSPAQGWYLEPTLLTNVQSDSLVAQEEFFGPVVALIAHDGDDGATVVFPRPLMRTVTAVMRVPGSASTAARTIAAPPLANLFLSTGDPLDPRSHVKYLFIRGEQVPLVDRHTKLYEEFKARPKPPVVKKP